MKKMPHELADSSCSQTQLQWKKAPHVANIGTMKEFLKNFTKLVKHHDFLQHTKQNYAPQNC